MINNCCQDNTKEQKSIQELKKDLDILNDENRLRILCLLKKQKRLCVCDIKEALDLPQNLASYHLGKLKEAGFLVAERQGAKVIYWQGGKSQKIMKTLTNILK